MALGKIGKPAMEPLIEALGDSGLLAAKALGEIGGARAVESLIGVLSDKNWQGRVFAALALGMIEDERAVEPLIKASGDDIPWVRNAAKEALKKLGHEVE